VKNVWAHVILVAGFHSYILWKTKKDDDVELVRNKILNHFKKKKKVNLRMEITSNMIVMNTNAISEWNYLKSEGVINELRPRNGHFPGFIFAHKPGLKLKALFKLLQFYPDIFKHQGYQRVRFEIRIGGEMRAFYLQTSFPMFGKHQIFVSTIAEDWHGTVQRGKKKKSQSKAATGRKYKDMIKHPDTFPDKKKWLS
jgi:hypothetical protein